MKVSIFGGLGFVGMNLAAKLLDSGYDIHIFGHTPVNNFFYNELLKKYPRKIKTTFGDFDEISKIDEVLFGADICFHLISTTQPKSSNINPIYDIKSNLIGTVNLLDACVANKIKKIIFTSSGGTVYGKPQETPIKESHPTNPECSYGIVKLAIEKYLNLYEHERGLHASILRLANPYGQLQKMHASQGAVAVFLGKVISGEPIEIWGDGTVIRDFIHVDDVVTAMEMCINSDNSSGIFNIGSGQGTSIKDLAKLMYKMNGVEENISYYPARNFDVKNNILDVKKAHDILGWHPKINLVEGIKKTIDWHNEFSGKISE